MQVPHKSHVANNSPEDEGWFSAELEWSFNDTTHAFEGWDSAPTSMEVASRGVLLTALKLGLGLFSSIFSTYEKLGSSGHLHKAPR